MNGGHTCSDYSFFHVELLFMTIAEEFIISRKDKGPGTLGPNVQVPLT